MTNRLPICIIAKPPRPGAISMGLSNALGTLEVAALARAFLLDTWSSICALDWARPVVVTTEEAPDGLGCGADAEVWVENRGEAVELIERTIERALLDSPAVMVLGVSTPGLPTRVLEDGRRLLERHDVVLGPLDAGGIYLVGCKDYPPGLLRNVPWGRPDTCVRALELLWEMGKSVGVLDPWFDVDEPKDLPRLKELIERDNVSAPQTAAAVEDVLIGRSIRAACG